MGRRGRRSTAPFDIVVGRQSVRAVLAAARRTVATVVVDRNAQGADIDEIRSLTRAAGSRLNVVQASELEHMAGGDFHQGVAAYVERRRRVTWEDSVAAARAGKPLVVLDHVEDPRNLGAVIRSTAAFAGGGIFLPARRQAHVTPVVTKAAAGGLEFVPLAPVGNVAQLVRKIKAAEIWCYGLEGDGEERVGDFPFAEAAAFILGGEGTGLSATVRRECDAVLAIPLAPGISSLNVAAAAAVTLYEFRRQHPVREP